MATAKWVQKQQEDLLPCRYFHLVFTLPHELNIIAHYNPNALYQCLFKATWQTLSKFAKRKKQWSVRHDKRTAYVGAELKSAYPLALFDTRRCAK